MKYTVVTGPIPYLADFIKSINTYLEMGWELIGGISVSDRIYYQAMIKK
jgi:hypothetical protein